MAVSGETQITIDAGRTQQATKRSKTNCRSQLVAPAAHEVMYCSSLPCHFHSVVHSTFDFFCRERKGLGTRLIPYTRDSTLERPGSDNTIIVHEARGTQFPDSSTAVRACYM